MFNTQDNIKSIFAVYAVLWLGLLAGASSVQANTLQDVQFSELPGERFEVRMDFSGAPTEPTGYTIERPARIVLDFAGVENALTQRKFPLSFGNAKSAVVLSSNDRTRIILNLQQLAIYESRVEGNTYIVEVGDAKAPGFVQKKNVLAGNIGQEQEAAADLYQDERVGITNIDFRRGEDGEGKIIITLSETSVNVDVEQVAGGMAVNFQQVDLPEGLRRSLDVVDFATPVSLVKADIEGANTRLTIKAEGDYDYLAYQTDLEYVISVKPLTSEEIEEKKARFSFVGEKLSLNFQNIEVRSVLQLIADFTELNLVASDTVTGSITLRLDNVPWDQALDLVLKAKGLDKRQVGNVLMVAPAAEIAERERQELETKRQLTELSPLKTEYIRLRYANAADFLNLFEDDSEEGEKSTSILSERGVAIIDDRTNSIILTETEQKIAEFKELVRNIDIPIRQVQIEARIVRADTDFEKEMGIKWGGIAAGGVGSRRFEAAGSQDSLDNDPGTPFDFFNNGGTTDIAENIGVDLGADPETLTSSFALSFINNNMFLTMELSALENSGHAEIVSQPKVITGDKQKAHIESGVEIPYLEASASGATSVSFKEAVLKLDVTPQITPDNQIIMELKVNQDSVGEIFQGIPSVDVTEVKTEVLVSNGQTVVLGGIYQTETAKGVDKVPFFGDLPYLGRFFRKDTSKEERRELLIFITPKILDYQR
jgi:type IV pilus assembly protein PilQ